MGFKQSGLPYPKDGLMPHISAETMDFHYGKHHAAYVSNLNKLISGTEYEKMLLDDIILKSSGSIFNNAAQIWNHDFFWACLSPNGGGYPDGKLGDLIKDKWKDFSKFKEEFSQSAISNFGSGWTWLVLNNEGQLEIINTSNAQTPITSNRKALLTIDVWEHAYYIDYRNARASFVEAFWNIVNWDFVNKNLLTKT